MSSVDGVDVAICVPFTGLRAMVDSARGSRVEVYAQNMHHEPEGAFTGEVSPPMLVELGVHGVVLGHSERRELFGETDRALALKVPGGARRRGSTPILCVGETEDEREPGTPSASCASRSRRTSRASPTERLGEVVIAYEPIWAIGTGQGGDPGAGAGGDRVHPRARRPTASREQAERTRVLYGG